MKPNVLFHEATYIQLLNAEAALTQTTVLIPASAAFIPVADFHRFSFLIGLGTLVNEVTFQAQQADAIDGTPKDITGAVAVAAATDDDTFISIEVGVDQLDINNGYTHVTLLVTGAGASADYAAIFFLGHVPGEQPVDHGALGATVELVG